MKRLFFYTYLFFSVLAHPAFGVYLEYEDENDTGRKIVVNFQSDERNQENVRRIKRVLSGTGLSFTEEKTTKTIKNGIYVYTTREKEFFTPSRAKVFIQWIVKSTELSSLHFLGVDEEHQVISVEQALLLIARKCNLFSLADEFFIMDTSSLPNNSEGIEMKTFSSKNEPLPDDLRKKIKHLSIICEGKKKEEAEKRVKAIIASHFKDIENQMVVK